MAPEIRNTRRKTTKDNTKYEMQLVQICGLLLGLPHFKKNITELCPHLSIGIHTTISVIDFHHTEGMTFQVTLLSTSAMVTMY